MSSTVQYNAFDRGIDPLLRLILSPDNAQSILEYEPDAWLRERIEELACKSNEGELTEEEQAEFEGYVRANNFIAIFRSKARNILDDVAE